MMRHDFHHNGEFEGLLHTSLDKRDGVSICNLNKLVASWLLHYDDEEEGKEKELTHNNLQF